MDHQTKDLLAEFGVDAKDLLKYYDIRVLLKKLLTSKVPSDLKRSALKMIIRLYYTARHGAYSTEYEIVHRYIDWITAIPWNTYTQDEVDLEKIRNTLESSHYGLTKVKERILSYMAAVKLKYEKEKREKGDALLVLRDIPVLLFVGLQGVGKTTIAYSIAKALGRRFIKVSLAAFSDVLYLRGKPKNYPDAEPGLIVKALVRTQSMNPVILLDEIEKVSSDPKVRNDVHSALLEIFDPTQNKDFVDKYIDYPIDLSAVFFIATANSLGNLPAALLDRVEIIRFTSYTDEEKIIIGKKYLLPKVLEKSGLDKDKLEIRDDAWPLIVRPMGVDAGIRQLERTLFNIARKVAYKILTKQADRVIITPDNVKEYLPDVGYLG